MSITKKELKKIREILPSGGYELIAEMTGLGIHSVKSSLFYPERTKTAVLETALKIIQEEKDKVEQLKKVIKEI